MGSPYGTSVYGSTPYGGSGLGLGTTPPILVSSTPADGDTGVALDATIVMTLQSASPSALDPFSLNVVVDGKAAIVNGIWVAGYAGTIVDNVTEYIVTISAHPLFDHPTVDVYVSVTDCDGLEGHATFSFNIIAVSVSDLVAKSWCEGKRIDLTWTNPVIPGLQMTIRRSRFSYCTFITDPGEDIYSGPAVSTYSDTGLDEDTFYYYTIFLQWVTEWHTNENNKVLGLSIKDYFARYGHYVYNLLPRTYRERDADPVRGTNQYKLRDYCLVLQCGINLYRGWAEGIVKLRDVDLMPAGKLGEATNQLGILAAQNYDLGFTPDKSFDAGLLRRMALSIIGITKKKGTCTGLVDLVKAFTTWDSRCDEYIEPVCGINRIFTSWDGESYFNYTNGPGTDPLYAAPGSTWDSATPGTFRIAAASVLSYGADIMPLTSTGKPTVKAIITNLGDFACVSSVSQVGPNYVLTFEDPTAYIRSELVGTGTAGGTTTWTIATVNASSYPWQFPAPLARPRFGVNAFAGMKLMDNTGAEFTVISSDGDVLELSGIPADGAYAIADDFAGATTYAARVPLLKVTFLIGEFSFYPATIWDTRMLAEGFKGPWSFTASLASSTVGSGSSGTPADVIMWVANEHEVLGTSTALTTDTLTDGTKLWVVNQWAGYYVLPNWDQTRLYRISANAANTLTVALNGGPGLDTVAGAGSHYVILSPENALKYAQLNKVLPNFVPVDTRPLVKFETP